MTVFEMLGHAVGFAGVCLIFASYQFKEKRIIMIGQTLGSLCICLQFFLIGAYTAFYINCVCLTRNVVFSFGGKLGKIKAFSPYFFAAAIVAVSLLQWGGPITLLMMLGLAINSVCLGIFDPQRLRASLLLTCLLIFIYDLLIGSYTGALNEALSMISATVALIRYKKSGKAE